MSAAPSVVPSSLDSKPAIDFDAGDLPNGQLRVTGKVIATRVYNGVRYTDLALPAVDEYKGPTVLEVRSPADNPWCNSHDAVGSTRTVPLALSSSVRRAKNKDGEAFSVRTLYLWLADE